MYVCVCVAGWVFKCHCACVCLSRAEGSHGLIVRRAFGLDTFRVVVIHDLVWNFCQNALCQRGRGGLKTQRQTERDRDRSQIHTHHQPSVAARSSNLLSSVLLSEGESAEADALRQAHLTVSKHPVAWTHSCVCVLLLLIHTENAVYFAETYAIMWRSPQRQHFSSTALLTISDNAKELNVIN